MNKQELENLIQEAAQAYYSGNPIMSDKRFDQYVEWLRAIDQNSSVLHKTGWGYDPNKVSGNKVAHIHGGMQSIDLKPRSIEEIPDRFRSNVRITPKLDGLSGVIHIKQGKFVKCLTRGNGTVGIDKTSKMIELLKRYGDVNIPDDVDCEIRGEFVISNSNWAKMLEEGTSKKNSRNAASGIINADNILPEFKYLDFVPYKLIYLNSLDYLTQPAEIELIQNWLPGFPKIESVYCEDSYNEKLLLDNYLKWKEVWPCDGVVITQYSMDIDENCITHYECAYKFDTLKKATKVINIDWQQSRLNLFKPVANLEPVELGGATVQRVTLHNAAMVKSLNIQPGSEVLVLRSGDVIPYLEEVISTDESSTAELPSICPCCGSKLEWQGVDLKCPNENCSNLDTEGLKVWVNNIGIVDGFGDLLLQKYFERFNINTIEDIYTTDLSAIERLLVGEGVQSVKFYEIMKKLKSDRVNLKNALLALNIPRLGEVSSDKLSKDANFILMVKELIHNNFDADKFEEDKIKYYDVMYSVVGDATSNSILDNFSKLSNLRYLSGRIYAKAEKKVDVKCAVCITGNLIGATRKSYVEMLKENGFDVKDDVNKKVSYLITNTPTTSSSKNKKADELGIPKLTQAQFEEKFSLGEYSKN